MYFLILFFKMVLVVFILLLSIAYSILVSEKVFGTIQSSKGPNVVGFLGLLQPLADGLKLFIKEMVFVAPSVKFLFVFFPFLLFLLFFLGLFVWSEFPFFIVQEFSLGVLAVLALSSLNSYLVMLVGWSSNSKYFLLTSMFLKILFLILLLMWWFF